MVTATPQHIKQLGQRLYSFIPSYNPDDHEAAIYMDEEGRFGFGPGPDVPAGCEPVATRARIAHLMGLHGYTYNDLARPDRADAFAALVLDNRPKP